MEDLPTQAMTQSAKGTRERPGTQIKAKAGLHRGILASGWYQLEQYLQYKAYRVDQVHPAYTSPRCSSCGYIAKANRPDQATFVGHWCGFRLHADVNAARNVQASGTGVMDGEGCSRRDPDDPSIDICLALHL